MCGAKGEWVGGQKGGVSMSTLTTTAAWSNDVHTHLRQLRGLTGPTLDDVLLVSSQAPEVPATRKQGMNVNLRACICVGWWPGLGEVA